MGDFSRPLTSGSHVDNPVLVVGSAACRAASLCFILLSHINDVVPAPDTNLHTKRIIKLLEDIVIKVSAEKACVVDR
jgi:hypothetical protein